MKKGGHYIASLHKPSTFGDFLVPFESYRRCEQRVLSFRIFPATVRALFAFQASKWPILAGNTPSSCQNSCTWTRKNVSEVPTPCYHQGVPMYILPTGYGRSPERGTRGRWFGVGWQGLSVGFLLTIVCTMAAFKGIWCACTGVSSLYRVSKCTTTSLWGRLRVLHVLLVLLTTSLWNCATNCTS